MRVAALLLLTFRTLLAGSYGTQPAVKPVLIVARDAVTMRNVWNAYVGRGEAPAIDFDKESVVFLFAGQRNTGGWSVAVKSVKIGRENAVVDATINGPPAGGFVTQAITSPFAVVALAKKNVVPVRWMDGKRVVVEEKPQK
jgi:hypothetical protein